MTPFEREIIAILSIKPMTIDEVSKKLSPGKNNRRLGQVIRDLAERKVIKMRENGGYEMVKTPPPLPNKKTPSNLPLKLQVLEKLRTLMAPDIAAVLKDIGDDLVR